MREKLEKLVFVYDADSGILSAIMDSARKLLLLNGCSLCRITHGLAGEKDDWKTCRDELGVAVEYLHRNELDDELQRLTSGRLPCVVGITPTRKVILLEPETLSRCRGNVGDFKGRLKTHAAMLDLETAF